MENSKGKVFFLFSNCIPTKGYLRSTIADMERCSYDLITNDLYDILQYSGKKTFHDLLKEYGVENSNVLIQYFEFLEEKEYIFWGQKNEYELFPPLSLEYDVAAVVSNATIEIAEANKHLYQKISELLNACGCKAICLVNSSDNLDLCESFLSLVEQSRIHEIDICLNYQNGTNDDYLSYLWSKFSRVQNIYVFNSLEERNISSKYKFARGVYLRNDIKKEICGGIHPSYFRVNRQMFTESKNVNNCLNKKIHINSFGYIYNCIYSKTQIGNVENMSVDALSSYLSSCSLCLAKKDEIEVCKDCEFRYICSDCRIFIRNKNNINSQPSGCPYNPYLGKWQWDNGYQPVNHIGISPSKL